MPEVVSAWLSFGNLMPLGRDGGSPDALLWLDIGAGSLLTLSHLAIVLGLIALARTRLGCGSPSLPFLFAALVAACGATHLLTTWSRFGLHPLLTTLLTFAAALLSSCAAVALWIALSRVRGRVAGTTANAVNRDLEERVQERIRVLGRANEQLLRSNAELQRFAYVASHDLQGPLRSIHGFMELLKREHAHKLEPEANEWIDRVLGGAERMQDMLDGLLHLSRIDTETRPPEPVDLHACALDSLDDLAADVQAQPDVTFHIGALPKIMGDPSQWRSVFHNLFSNSLKYRAERPLIVDVRSIRTNDGWRVEIRDTGRGIPKQYTEDVFQLFRRSDPARVRTGYGIGLAMCKRIVERHLGSIGIESDGESGTTVWIELKG